MNEGKEQRRLAAVMFCDIKGYTALVQRDEQTALKKVGQFRKALEENTTQYHGEVIEFYGDGSLSVYPSVIDAIHCAIKMQEAYRSDDPVPVRVGIHLGDIVFKDGTVYGDGVNLASRIESAGVPGAILISEKVNRELSNHPQIKTKSLGFFSLKNVQHKIEIHAIDHPSVLLPTGQIGKAKRAKGIKWVQKGAIAFLSVAALVFLINTFLMPNQAGPRKKVLSDIVNEKIAVRPFQNNTLIDSLNVIGDLAGDFLTRELLKTEKANVISYRTQSELQNSGVVLAGSTQASRGYDPSVIFQITGSFRIKGVKRDSIIFSASVEDNNNGDVLLGFDDQVAPIDNPFLALQKLDNQIRGFWESKNEKLSSPPNFEAYKAFIRAREAWFSDDETVEQELKNAIRLDSSFTDPYFYLFTHYYDRGTYSNAEQILDLLDANQVNFTQRQKTQIRQMRADLKGENKNAYMYFLEEYENDPQDIFLNGAAMAYAIEYVNDPAKAIQIFNEIPVDQFDYNLCAYCVERLHIAQLAYMELGKPQKAKKIIEKMPARLDNENHFTGQVRYYVYRKDTSGINRIIQNLKGSGFDSKSVTILKFTAAHEFRLRNEQELARFYAEMALNELSSDLYYLKGEILDVQGEYDLALAETEKLVNQFPNYQIAIAKLGVLYARLNQKDQAIEIINRLDSFSAPHSFGTVPYQQAVIYAQLGQTQTALDKIEEAIQNGCKFSFFDRFETDPDLLILKDDPRFKELMKAKQ
jgi:class 3 adenylate cyclase/tetratricopeptide (TPR) repeat protein